MPSSQRPGTRLHRAQLFHEAVAVVEQEYAGDLALEDVARRIACSRRQLQRAYAEAGNTSFRDHLTSLRMRHAAELLRAEPVAIREIARRVGYRQPAQFAKAFRRAHGVAPSTFRAAERSAKLATVLSSPARSVDQLAAA